MRARRRLIGGVWFTCVEPGSWLSEDGRIAAVHMMAGTSLAQWELYLTEFAKGIVRRVPKDPNRAGFMCCDHWCGAYTLGELASDIAKLDDWAYNLARNIGEVCKTQHQYRGWGFGPPDPKLGFEIDGKARSPRLCAGL